MREKMTFFNLGGSLPSEPFDHKLRFDVFMESWDVGGSVVYAEGQK